MIAVALSPSASWLAIGLGLFVLWQIVKRLPWEEVSEDVALTVAPEVGRGPDGNAGLSASSLTSLRAGERGQAGAPFDGWGDAA